MAKKQIKPIKKSSSIEHSKINTASRIPPKQNPIITKNGFPTYNIKNSLLAILIILSISFAAYFPSLNNDFTNWDDTSYASEYYQHEKEGWDGIKDEFTHFWMGNYHPLAMLSLKIDFNLSEKRKPTNPDNKRDYEPKPFLFILHNLILHLFNTVFVFIFTLLLIRLYEQKYRNQKPPYFFIMAIITGLLFGVHAIHVESVAWVSERKDVLYTFFFLLSAIFYVKYLGNKNFTFLILSILSFIFSLLSKGQAVSLSITIIAIDIFLGRNWKNYKIWLEKVPFLLLSLLFGIIAIWAQKAGSAIHDIADYFFHERIIWASYGLTQYILKLSIPFDLTPLYPYPYKSGHLPLVYFLYIIPAIVFLYTFYLAIKKNRLIAFSIAFYLINIFLLLQLLPVGSAVMADRYAYIPSIGYFIFISALVPLAIEKKYIKIPLAIIIALMVGYNSFFTYKQTDVWQNSLSLWNHTIELEPKAVVAWNNRGSTKEKFKLHADAIKDFDEAISLKPDYAHAYYNRGTARKNLGDMTLNPDQKMKIFRDALDDYNKAIILIPDFDKAFHNRGIIYDNLGQFDLAMKDFEKALEIAPNNFEIFINRGVVYGKMNLLDKAIDDFNRAIKLNPRNSSAYSNRGLANNIAGNTEAALADYNKAIELEPGFATAYSNRGLIYKNNKNYEKAVDDFTKSIERNPNFADAYFHRAAAYVAMNNFSAACKDFKTAQKLGYQDAALMIEKYCK